MKKKAPFEALPLEGGGLGGGENVELTLARVVIHDLTPLPTSPPLGARGLGGAHGSSLIEVAHEP